MLPAFLGIVILNWLSSSAVFVWEEEQFDKKVFGSLISAERAENEKNSSPPTRRKPSMKSRVKGHDVPTLSGFASLESRGLGVQFLAVVDTKNDKNTKNRLLKVSLTDRHELNAIEEIRFTSSLAKMFVPLRIPLISGLDSALQWPPPWPHAWKNCQSKPAPSLPPFDLEAICPLPGHENHYLLLESHARKEKYGRVFVVKINQKRSQAEIVETLLLPRVDDSNTTLFEGKDNYYRFSFEGMACIPQDQKVGGFWLLLAHRGGDPKGHPSGVLVSSFSVSTSKKEDLNFKKRHLPYLGFSHSCGPKSWRWDPSKEGHRNLSEILVHEQDDNNVLLIASAAYDPGDSSTSPPFSFIYCPFRIVTSAKKWGELLIPIASTDPLPIKNHKVEALLKMNPLKAGGVVDLILGTDDDDSPGRIIATPIQLK